MSKKGTLSPRKSIRFKSLVLFIGFMTTSAIALVMIALYVTRLSGQSAQQTASQALTAQAEEYLVQLTQSSARENDLILKQVLQDVEEITTFTADIFSNREKLRNENYWSAEEHMAYGEQGQYLNGLEDISSVFVPNTTEIGSEVVEEIELSAYLDFIFASTFRNITNIEAMYFATPRDVVRYYPNIHLGMVVPPDFQASQRIWFSGSTSTSNPRGETWWTPPYVDATGLGLVTTAAKPVYNPDGELLGVVGLDMTLTGIKSSIEAIHFLQSGYSFMIDNTGHAIALPNQGYQDFLGRPPEEDELYADLTQAVPELEPVIAGMIAGKTGFEKITIAGKERFVSYSPLESTGWSIGSIVDTQDVLGSLASLQANMNQTTNLLLLTRILPMGLVLIVFAVLAGLIVTSRIARPIQQLANQAEKLGRGHWEIDITPTGDDEIGILAQTFKSMAEQIRDHVSQLEKRVAERTRDIERRTLQIRVAAEVARDASIIQNLDELLERAVDLIRGRFGFYHAGIFLVDAQNEYAVLQAATGEAGRKMIENGHKLKIGEVGIVGHVTGSGKPRIALDVGSDAVHFKNPLLPETRSEMALPLKVGNRIIGALDVQSQYPSAFTADDITILQIMADQLAVAIENARLLKEYEQSLHELRTVYGRYSEEAWQKISHAQKYAGYQYDLSGIHPLEPDQAYTDQSSVRIPLEVRGQEIGHLEIWPEADDNLLTQDLEILRELGDRVSQAMESARLFEEAQRRAERERLASEITAKLRSTNDPQAIMQTAVKELREALRASRAQVLLNPVTPNQSASKDSGDNGHSKTNALKDSDE